MSNDIYIPLDVVLSHPAHFELTAALNGDFESAAELIKEDNPLDIDWRAVESELKPLVMCQFGARSTLRVVYVIDHDLLVCCGGAFRTWLLDWLVGNDFKFLSI